MNAAACMNWKTQGEESAELRCIMDDQDDTISINNEDRRTFRISVLNGDINQNVVKNDRDFNVEPFPVHAFSKIFTGTKRESLFWLLIAIIGISTSIIIIIRLVDKYYRYEVVTEVTWNVTSRNVFPSITFCDVNLMSGQYFAYCGVPHGLNHENMSISCPHEPKINPEIHTVLNTSHKWSNGIFHVLKCFTWDGKICTTDKYFKSVRRLNHTCFTWNWNGDLYDTYGHAYIEFIVNDTIQSSRRRGDSSYIFGEIHDPNIKEIAMTNSFRIEPSNIFNLRIRKTIIKRLPAPFPSRCVASMPHHIFAGPYTRRTCIESIIYIQMLKDCGDILDYHKLHIPKNILKKYKRNRTISEVLSCMLRYSFHELIEIDVKTCPTACSEMDLVATSSSYELKKEKVGSRVFYAINIQYQDLDYYKIVEEKQKFTCEQMIAEVGGVLCLLIGASFITIIELSIFFCRWLSRKCSAKRE